MIPLLPELFLDQARSRPRAPAVVAGPDSVTYGELERSACRIANALIARGIGVESAVGLLVPPGPEMVAALLGIWLAGGCYVPLDPLAPADRLRRVVESSGARAVLTGDPRPQWDPGLPQGVATYRVDELASHDATTAPSRAATARQAAYMLFTSGSTGEPKGVVVEHEGIANRVHWGVRALGLSVTDRVLQKTPLTFDAAGWEIFAPLICGAPVTFGRSGAGRDAGELVASIREQRATVVQAVPSMLRLLAAEPDLERCGSLRLICSAGEPLQAELCARIVGRVDVEIWNTYGPTECSIDVLAARFDRGQRTGPVPIGRPIDNMRSVLMPPDDAPADDAPAEDGAPRRLYVGGPGVARGYHRDAARTAERFLPDPSGPPGSRLYDTGDLVRTLPDGALEFAGRADAQVKINGVRIEPGEVEAALETHPDVVEAAVRAVEDPRGVPRLAAWVVLSSGDAPDRLVRYLRDRLPPTLVPSVITGLDALPRTASGKTDRSRLPAPDWTRATADARSQVPHTAEERIVLAAWRRVLGVDRVGLDDDFFGLGGHSLLMTALATEIAEVSGLVLDFRELHYAATAREQARLLAAAVEAKPIDRLPAGSRLPLSPAQERFWVLDRAHPGSRNHLIPIFVWLPVDVPEKTVEEALSRLAARHEVLRTRYVMDAEGLAAVVEPAVRVPLRAFETTAARTGEIVAAQLAEGFDLREPPMLRATLLRDGADEQLLLLVCHHIVCDGWSSRILEREVRELVAAVQEHRAPALADPPVRYTDAVAWQRAQLTGPLLADQLGYWRDTLADLPALELPNLGPGGAQRDAEGDARGAAVGFDLPAETAAALLAAGRDAGASPFVVFLTLWTVLLARAGGQWDFGVGSPHAGRSRPELHDVVGLFVNVVVVRSRLVPELSFTQALGAVERVCREGFARHAVPFEAVADAVAPVRDRSRTPLFQTLFTMTGDDLVGQLPRERDLELLGQAWTAARTDLALTLWPYADGRHGGAVEYATALCDETAAVDLADRLCALAARFAADPDLLIGEAGLEHAERADDRSEEPPVHLATILGFIRDLLKQQSIGPDDDVVEHGGNSLMAARLLWSVENAFGVEISMRAFFDRPTARGLSLEVEKLITAEIDGLEQQGDGRPVEEVR
jgi:amino acid adenylation domain-containing protein